VAVLDSGFKVFGLHNLFSLFPTFAKRFKAEKDTSYKVF
jgi:hypothetical protein